MSNWGNQKSEGGKAGYQGGSNTTSNTGISGPSFDNLYEQKRSTDPTSVAKREALADQKPAGIISQMWNKHVSGPGGPTPPSK